MLIGIWGSDNRTAAAWKITIYLALGSFILLLGLIMLYQSVPVAARSFDIRTLQEAAVQIAPETQRNIYLILLVGFGILVSLCPFHTWAPDAYAAAPPPAAMLHAGVLKKFGVYGLLRVVVPMLPAGARSCRKHRNHDTQQTVDSKFLQHPCVQHRGRRRCSCVGIGRPGVKWTKRNENAEADEQNQVNVSLRLRSDLHGGFLQCANIKTARGHGHALIKHDQTEEQNETAQRKIDCNLPRRGGAVIASPNADQQERRNECELVKGICTWAGRFFTS